MGSQHRPAGKITVSQKAIATIAAYAASRSYGIVGMAHRNLADGIAFALARDPRHGVVVRVGQGALEIELFVVVEYGTRVSAVASSVARTVRYNVERALGMPIAAVHVNVQSLHVSNAE
jgi:uncharacterized alkaline shock family protein YloU